MTNNNINKKSENSEQINNSRSTENKSTSGKRKKKKKKRSIAGIIGMIFIVLFLIGFFAAVVAAGFVGQIALDIVETSPKIDPSNMLSSLSQSSVIVSQTGAMIEQIHDPNENRDIVELEQIPLHLQQAFIAIEDQRFYTHFGIDITRIGGALINNLTKGDLTDQGASTLTQQLVKNVYLYDTKTFERKVTEMYLAVKVEQVLEKDQILENYLNTIPFGQSASGVQAASFAYFSKDVSELTLAEAALLAAVPNAPSKYSPFFRTPLEEVVDVPEEDIVGHVYIGSIQYACVFNPESLERQQLILKEMFRVGFITEEEYNDALEEDMKLALNPGVKKIEGVNSNNFNDYVTDTVIEDLMQELELTYEEAEQYLYKGGLTIYSTMDIEMQRTMEAEYDYFVDIFVGENPPDYKPAALYWSRFGWSGGESYGILDAYDNILNRSGQVFFYKHSNILTEDDELYFTLEEYSFDEDGNMIINTEKIKIYSYLDVANCYTITENNELKTHNIGGLNIGTGYEIVETDGEGSYIKILKSFLDENQDFYTLIADDIVVIDDSYYLYDDHGVLQPQSASVIIDYRTGHIKSIVGGRDIEGSKTLNRAVDAVRQPGSTIKPLTVYLTALDRGYTAASVLDDIPLYNESGDRYPMNWYNHFDFKYRGLSTIRYALQQSINTIPYILSETMGVETIVPYMDRLGMIDSENPENDTFVSHAENPAVNDMFSSALALGGFSNGFSPLVMTAAYGAIANDGVYVEPICYTKIVDSNGNLIIDNVPKTEVVVSPQVAFILEDILVGSVSGPHALAYPAAIDGLGIEMAAKTGTTQNDGDMWSIGYSPYYVGGVWVGCDEPTMTLSETSTDTARLLGTFMTSIHQGLEPAEFDMPEGIVTVAVCQESGLLPSELCSQDLRGSQVVWEYFIEGSQPKETCETHVKANVCNVSNMLFSEFCPEDHKEERILIQREIPYDLDMFPYEKGNNFEELTEALTLFYQIQNDIRTGMSPRDIHNLYPGLVTFNVYNSDGTMLPDDNGDKLPDYLLLPALEFDVTFETDLWHRIEITSVLGFSYEELNFSRLYVEDYEYQVPTDICNWHGFQTWYNGVLNPPPEDSLLDSDGEPSEDSENNENNESSGNEGTSEDGDNQDSNESTDSEDPQGTDEGTAQDDTLITDGESEEQTEEDSITD